MAVICLEHERTGSGLRVRWPRVPPFEGGVLPRALCRSVCRSGSAAGRPLEVLLRNLLPFGKGDVRCGTQRREPLRRVADEVGQRTGCCARSPLSDGSLPAACTTTGAIPAPPVEGAGFGPTPACPHGAPAAPSRFRYVVEHQPTARVGTLAEPAGIAAREQ